MKNVRVKVNEYCTGNLWDVGIFNGGRRIIISEESYPQKNQAIRRAKSVAKRCGIKYDSEIVKAHGC